MSDIKLFKLGDEVEELEGKSFSLERSLQRLIEDNLESFFEIRFLATEYSTGKNHGGRIDSLGIDENCCPVIIEYKRSSNENVITQGLYYLDWLLDHKAEFKNLVRDRLGEEEAEKIEWDSTRLICIAGDFNKFDEHAVKQINRNIELVRYKSYGKELILFQLVNVTTATNTANKTKSSDKEKVVVEEETVEDKASESEEGKQARRTVSEAIESADEELTDRYYQIRDFIMALGDDVQEKTLKHYMAFKRMKNFVCLEVHTQTRNIILFLKVEPSTVQLEEGFSRDVTNKGHFGTGNLELNISNMDDFEKAKELIIRSYENS